MANSRSFDRRRFIKVCASAGAAVVADPGLMAQPAGELVPAERVRLVDTRGRTLRPDSLNAGESYVFNYPFVTTPCFLIDLGRATEPGADLATEDGRTYRWSGGVGPGRSIVAFSAICAHRMSYPTREVSFISYRHKPVSESTGDAGWWNRGQVIYCCSEGSVYDPRDGARVLAGPAPQPLAAIRLEYDADESAMFATGIYGGDMIQRFFDTFGFQVALARGHDDIRKPAHETATVWPFDEYSRNSVC